MVTHMIAVGESTGALDAMLGKIADFYEDEVDQAVASLTSLLEPMMVFLGVVIGFMSSRCTSHLQDGLRDWVGSAPLRRFLACPVRVGSPEP